jgi:hypothetical protein
LDLDSHIGLPVSGLAAPRSRLLYVNRIIVRYGRQLHCRHIYRETVFAEKAGLGCVVEFGNAQGFSSANAEVASSNIGRRQHMVSELGRYLAMSWLYRDLDVNEFVAAVFIPSEISADQCLLTTLCNFKNFGGMGMRRNR